jgi:hypothetical protein
MMPELRPRAASVLSSVLLATYIVVGLAADAESEKPLNKHEQTWTAFANNTLALHKKLISQTKVQKKTRVGGYADMPAFYIENAYYDTRTHKLISQVQWEKANPNMLHTIQVNVYDDAGRVTRDFAAAYLPDYHRSPTQTLISLHNYNGQLHAFRTFDASGFRIVEGCRGKYQGKQVELLLDEEEIDDGVPVMKTPLYKACFGDMQVKAGKYLIPQ